MVTTSAPFLCMTLLQMNAQLRAHTQRQIDRGTMSVKLLAAKSGMSEPHISLWLHGKRDCSLFALSAVLHVLGMAVELVPAAKDERR